MFMAMTLRDEVDRAQTCVARSSLLSSQQRDTTAKSDVKDAPLSDVPTNNNMLRLSWRSWIRASWYNYENNQQDGTIEVNLLKPSGFFTYHQV
jgi:hypothetical protein